MTTDHPVACKDCAWCRIPSGIIPALPKGIHPQQQVQWEMQQRLPRCRCPEKAMIVFDAFNGRKIGDAEVMIAPQSIVPANKARCEFWSPKVEK